ncbi:hypothetical protein [Rossellomorea sp. NRS-1567]|uniref:hypothetical protein n=1 Tax=Rossellomorea sp. NRS-1567 TaxID=3233901 RepID=UPI003D2CF111
MKKLAIGFILLHVMIFLLWIMNSGYLFSPLGITCWMLAIVSGFIVQIKLDEVLMIRKIMAISNGWMVFLIIMTVGIHFTVTSMP